VAANTCSPLPYGSTTIEGGCGLEGAGSLTQLHGAMLERLLTFPRGQFEKSPLKSKVPELVVVVGVVVVVVVVLVELVLVVLGVVVVVVVVVGVVVVVDVEVVVVGGGGLVGFCTTGVGFDVPTADPFLFVAVTTSRRV